MFGSNLNGARGLARLAGVLVGVLTAGSAVALPPPLPVPEVVTEGLEQFESWISFVNGTEHNWGNIWEHEPVQHTFEFVNSGKREVRITNTEATCGCTVPSIRNEAGLAADTFQPGERGFIDVRFDPKNRPGHQLKQVKVTLNNEPSPRYELSLSSQVLRVIEHEPPVVFIRRVEKFVEPRPTFDFSIIGRTPDFDTTLSRNPVPEVYSFEKLGIEDVTHQDGTKGRKVNWRVTVSSEARPGRVNYNVAFDTNDPRIPTYSVAIGALVMADVTINPERVTLGRVVPNELSTTTFEVSSASKREFTIKDVSISGPLRGAEWKVEPIDPARKDAYRVTVSKVFTDASAVTGQITVITDLTDEALVKTNYQAWTPGAAGPGVRQPAGGGGGRPGGARQGSTPPQEPPAS